MFLVADYDQIADNFFLWKTTKQPNKRVLWTSGKCYCNKRRLLKHVWR